VTIWQAAMSGGNLPKIVDKIDPYNQSSLKRVRRGSVGSTRFHTKAYGELKQLPLLKGKLYLCLFNQLVSLLSGQLVHKHKMTALQVQLLILLQLQRYMVI